MHVVRREEALKPAFDDLLLIDLVLRAIIRNHHNHDMGWFVERQLEFVSLSGVLSVAIPACHSWGKDLQRLRKMSPLFSRLAKLPLLSTLILTSLVLFITLFRSTNRIIVKAGEAIPKPEFPFEIMRETVPYYSGRTAAIYLLQKHYSEQNVLQLSRWYSHVNCSLASLELRVYTDRRESERDESWDMKDSFHWQDLVKDTPYDAPIRS